VPEILFWDLQHTHSPFTLFWGTALGDFQVPKQGLFSVNYLLNLMALLNVTAVFVISGKVAQPKQLVLLISHSLLK